ncbi:HTH_Tnp_Tc3_2 domain-containing protein [Trichonephila clavipes]|nr:HTH_Tnp_Tc3_2 domain-containing protein [Trichonephila clavipes]
MPLRRNRRQYEQLTDFDRGASEKQVGRIDVSAATPRSERYGSCSVLATVDHRRHPVPSRETIRRRLTEVGLRSRRPLRRLPLTPHHRQCRLDFCRPRATWSVTDWRRVIFSDESRFSLSADDHRTRVWRRTGQRSDPAFIVERHTAISQARRLARVRTDTKDRSEDVACVWIANHETVGPMRAYRMMCQCSQPLTCRGRPEPGHCIKYLSLFLSLNNSSQ